jgi:hypothetical protein
VHPFRIICNDADRGLCCLEDTATQDSPAAPTARGAAHGTGMPAAKISYLGRGARKVPTSHKFDTANFSFGKLTLPRPDSLA